MSAYTPGPWKVDTWADGRNICGVATEDGYPICEMFHGGDFGSQPTSYEWKIANARLIAAAPELLALVIRYRNETPLGNQPAMIAGAADEAIAKATQP